MRSRFLPGQGRVTVYKILLSRAAQTAGRRVRSPNPRTSVWGGTRIGSYRILGARAAHAERGWRPAGGRPDLADLRGAAGPQGDPDGLPGRDVHVLPGTAASRQSGTGIHQPADPADRHVVRPGRQP